MNRARFDYLVRSFAEAFTRRGLIRGLAAAGLALPFPLGVTEAKKRKKKSKKPKPNAFGCLNVGQRCGGNSGKCCSGICQGKKPKKGKKDKSRCVGHNTGGCISAEDSCGEGNPNVPCGAGGFCLLTTGNAPFCGLPEFGQGACAACRTDTDCQGSFGEGAACVSCATFGCSQTGDRACIPAAA